MEILSLIWEQYLYIPLFNLLVWIYLNYSNFNLGVAVIILTLALRFVLLPFTLLTERGKLISYRLRKDIADIKKDYSDDPIKQKIEIRRFLKTKKIRPWAKAISLAVQALTIVLLYRVFIGGINTEEKLHLLYPNIFRPDFINTNFLWFDIGQRDLTIAAVAAGYIFAQILIKVWDHRRQMNNREQIYSLLFPATIFLILAILPAAKSIFILTSLVFSSIISVFTALIKISIERAKKPAQE